jgi:homoserine acetyltransferase
VFVAHFFSGTSRAAGRYSADEKSAGYWDTIIGPGKAIDTDRYFVLSADTLVNLNVKSASVGTVKTDLIFPPELSRRWADKLKVQGNHVELYEIEGSSGHLDGLFSIAKVADRIKAFLEK